MLHRNSRGPALKFEHNATIDAPIEKVWAFLMDIPAVAKCAPGMQSVEPLGDDKYRGTIVVSFGPARLTLQGDVAIVEKDEVNHYASMKAEATDKRAGGAVKAVLGMSCSTSGSGTQLKVETDADVLGRIGEFGQPFIRRKAEQTMNEFTNNLQKAIAARG